MKHFVVCLWLFLWTSALAQDRVIGHVGSQSVLESQLKGSDDATRAEHLRDLVVFPAIRAYLQPHQQRLKPTDQEIQRFMQLEREDRQCRGEADEPEDPFFAEWMVSNLKLQRYIYEQHGAGRLRFQQMGTEAFDATREMILELERRGAFAIHSAELRRLALNYWLEPNGPLMPDPGVDKAFEIERALNTCPSR